MDDFRLPAPLVGLLKLSKLKGIPEFDIRHKTDSVEVTIYWKKATPAASKKNSTTSKSTSAKTKSKPPSSKPTTKSTPQAVLKPVSPKATPKPVSPRANPKPTRILPVTPTPSLPKTNVAHSLRRRRCLHHVRRRLLSRLPYVGRLPLPVYRRVQWNKTAPKTKATTCDDEATNGSKIRVTSRRNLPEDRQRTIRVLQARDGQSTFHPLEK